MRDINFLKNGTIEDMYHRVAQSDGKAQTSFTLKSIDGYHAYPVLPKPPAPLTLSPSSSTTTTSGV